VPTAEDHPPLVLDVQAIIHQLYDAGGYYKFMYESSPVPPLTPADAAWAHGILADAGITGAAQ
jgi:hypothetical protein